MLRPLILAITLALTATPSLAAPLAPTKPSDMRVAFQDSQTPCPSGNARAVTKSYAADGQITDFAIPPKQVLVVNQVDWFIDNATASQATTLELTMYTPNSSQIYLMVDGGTGDANGKIRKTTLTSPLIVPAGNTICVRSSSGTVGAFVHGFVTKAK
jgi:hypothetical protein